MTTPLLPFSFLGTWGSPLHGKVQNGLIHLPNMTTQSYPQPSTGDTYLVKFAGLPDVTRNAEQQASDTLAGYEWRKYAIIAGDGFQLHGRTIGTPWLHRDETGKVWKVEVGHVPGNTVTLTLTEFGVFRLEEVAAQVIELEVTLPDLGMLPPTSITLMDVRPQGNQAVFLAARANDQAMFTISLTSLSGSAAVLKSIDDMLVDRSVAEETLTIPDELQRTPSFMRGNYDQGVPGQPSFVPGSIEFSDSPLSGSGYDFAGISAVNYDGGGSGRYMSFAYITGTESKEQTIAEEKFYWANYDKDGDLHYYSSIYSRTDTELTVKSGDYTGGWSISCSSSTESPGSVTGAMSGSLTLDVRTTITETQTYKYQLCRDSVVIDEYVITLSEYDESGTDRVVVGATPSIGVTDGGIIVYNEGGGASTTPVEINDREADFDGDDLDADLDVVYGGTYYSSDSAKEFSALSAELPSFEIIQSTNKLCHMVTSYTYKPGFNIGYHVGPEYEDAVRNEVADLDELHATCQPVDGEIIREQSTSVSFV